MERNEIQLPSLTMMTGSVNLRSGVDISTHLTELNTRLQWRLQLISAMLDHVTSFEIKLLLWGPQLKSIISCNFQLCRSVISRLSLVCQNYMGTEAGNQVRVPRLQA